MTDLPLPRQFCTALTRAGSPCKCVAIPGKVFCRWHSPDPEDIAKALEESYRGGHAAKPASGRWAETGPLIELVEVEGLDLSTAAGLAAFTAAALKKVAELPFSVRTGHALAALLTVQRQAIETMELEARLAALEAAPGPVRRVS